MRLAAVGLLLLISCGSKDATPPKPEPIPVQIEKPVVPSTSTHVVVPDSCLKALDLVERVGAKMANRVPSSGGMTSEEVDRLVLDLRRFEEQYRELASRCRSSG